MGQAAGNLVRVYGLAVVSTAAALLLTLALNQFGVASVFLLFFPAVVASAWFGGLTSGLTATVLSAITVNYFLYPPSTFFGFPDLPSAARMVIFIIVAITISTLSAAGQRAGRAQQQLEDERRFRGLLEAAPDSIIVADADGTIRLVNSQTERLFGYTRSELLGKPVELLMPAGPLDTSSKHAANHGIPLRAQTFGGGLEVAGVRRDGSAVPLEASLSPMETADGLLVIATLRDITERREVQERLRQQQAQLADAQLIAGIGSWEWDIATDTITWSVALYRIYGFVDEQPPVTYLTFLQLVHPDDRSRVDTIIKSKFDEGTSFQFEHRIVRPDGAVRMLSARGEVVRDAMGNPLRMVGTGEDITERLQAAEDRERLVREHAARAAAEENQRRLTFLTDVSAMLASSLDYEQTLQRVAETTVPFLADWCIISIVTEGGQVQQLAVAHSDPAMVERVRALQSRFPVDLQHSFGVGLTLQTGQTQFVPEITDRLLEEAGLDADWVQFVRELGLRSAMIVPMTARGRTLGALALLRAESGRNYTGDDVLLAETLARRAALAVDNSLLYRQAREAQEQAQRNADRATTLAEIARLASAASLDLQEALDVLSRRIGGLMGDFCLIRLVSEDGATLPVFAAYHQNPDVLRHTLAVVGNVQQRSNEGLAGQVMQTGKPLLVREFSLEAMRDRITPGYGSLYEEAQPQSILAVPLIVRGRVTGVLSVVRMKPGLPYTDDDVAFLQGLADHTALAVENARLYQAEQVARRAAEDSAERTARLQAVTEALAEASHAFSAAVPDFQELLDTIAQRVSEATGEVCSVRLLSEDSTVLLPSAVWHRDPAVRGATRRLMVATPGVVGGLWRGVLRERRLTIMDMRAGEAPPWAVPELVDFIQTYRPSQVMGIPLEARGRLLGGIALTRFDPARPFSYEEQALFRDLAERAGLAIDNARLYLEAEDQRLRLFTVLEQMPLGVVIAEATDGRYSFQNSAARQFSALIRGTEASPEDPQEGFQNVRYLRSDGTPLTYDELPVVQALQTGATTEAMEMVCEGPAQRRTLLASAVPLKDGEGRVTAALAVTQDITERKTLEEQKDEFLSLAAHELKTPLTVVKGNSQLLQRMIMRGRWTPEQATPYLQLIEQRVRYMEELIGELLDVSRIETGRLEFHPTSMDLAELLRSTVAQQAALHPTTPFHLTGAADPLPGVWDRGRIEQVLTNLLDNAGKYSKPGGTVRVTAVQQDGTITVTVADQGIGIPAGDLPHIFDRHYRAQNVERGHSGLGLGLYLTQQIVQRHGGQIWVESTEDEGATFHFTLPVTGAAASLPPAG